MALHSPVKVGEIDAYTRFGETYRNVRVYQGQYFDGPMAVMLATEDGEPLSTVSINLDSETMADLAPGEFWAADYSETEGQPQQLAEAGVIVLTGETTTFGYGCTAHKATLTPALAVIAACEIALLS